MLQDIHFKHIIVRHKRLTVKQASGYIKGHQRQQSGCTPDMQMRVMPRKKSQICTLYFNIWKVTRQSVEVLILNTITKSLKNKGAQSVGVYIYMCIYIMPPKEWMQMHCSVTQYMQTTYPISSHCLCKMSHMCPQFMLCHMNLDNVFYNLRDM